MKETDLTTQEAIRSNALEVKAALLSLLAEERRYDNPVQLFIVDKNGTSLSAKLSMIGSSDKKGIIFSNLRSDMGIIDEIGLKRLLYGEYGTDDARLLDMSIELYNENCNLYISSHVTSVKRDPLGWITISNSENI
jgi:hypothetical protein